MSIFSKRGICTRSSRISIACPIGACLKGGFGAGLNGGFGVGGGGGRYAGLTNPRVAD